MERGTTLSGRPVVGAGLSRAARSTATRVGALEWLRILRFRAWARFLVLPIAGVDLAAPVATSAAALARGVAIAAALLAFGYLANSLGDRGMDRDPEKNALLRATGELPLWRALSLLAVVALVACVSAPAFARAATVLCLASGWAYSLGPRCKRVPIVGTLMNVANFAPLLFVGVGDAGAPARLWWLTPAFAALLVQNQLLHEAADAPEDRAGAIRTTFVALGAAATALLAALSGLALVGVALAIVIRGGRATGAFVACAVLALPFVVIFPLLLSRRGASSEAMARARVAQRWSAIVAGAALALMA